MRVSVSDPRRVAYVVAAACVAAHARYIAPSLEDIDSIKLRPGASRFRSREASATSPGLPRLHRARSRAADARIDRPACARPDHAPKRSRLAIWSLVAGVVAVFASASYSPFLRRSDRLRQSGASSCLQPRPLFWLSGLRPMSDLPGLSAALVAQVLILEVRKDCQRLVYAALASGVAIGIRLQSAWFTVPLLALALVAQRALGVRWLMPRPVAAFAAGGLAWGVPLVVDSGGVESHLASLGTQAGEDFAGVEHALAGPDAAPSGCRAGPNVRAALGLGRPCCRGRQCRGDGAACLVHTRDRHALVLLLVAFGPHAALHLLFQETLTVRYALPTLVPVVWLAARAFSSRRTLHDPGGCARRGHDSDGFGPRGYGLRSRIPSRISRHRRREG